MTDDARDSSASRGSVAHPLAESLRDMSDTLNACGNDFSDILLDAAGELDRRRWIPVTERLPMTSADVLVTEQGEDEQFIGSLEKGRWSCSSTNHALRVTHWMPLPAPPSDGK